MIKALLDAGQKLERCASAFSYLRDNLGDDLASRQLVIAGTSAVLVREGENLIHVVNRTRARACSTCSPLDAVRSQVDAAIAAPAPKRPPRRRRAGRERELSALGRALARRPGW